MAFRETLSAYLCPDITFKIGFCRLEGYQGILRRLGLAGGPTSHRRGSGNSDGETSDTSETGLTSPIPFQSE